MMCTLGYSEDETSSPVSGKTYTIANLTISKLWGDGRTWSGTLVPVQPMLEPL